MHETSAQGWCTGMTQRDGTGREVTGGFRMGNTCKSMADSCQCMAKTIASFGIAVHERIVNGVKTQAQCPAGLVTLKIPLENFSEACFFFPCMENIVRTFVSKVVMRLKRLLVHSKAFRVEVFLEA